jgi:acyl carrier protein
MTELKDRVADCFCAVFPTHSREELLTAKRESIAEWDSLAGVTLFTLVEQEFGVPVDLLALEHMDSVDAVTAYVAEHADAAGEPDAR